MIEVNAYTDDDILAIQASGKLSKEDLDDIEPALNKFAIASDDPHLIITLEDFGGWQNTAAF